MNKAVLILVCMVHFAHSQDVIVNTTRANPVEISSDFNLFIPSNQNKYITSQWGKGKLFYTNETTKNYDSLNFDRYANVLEVVINNKALSILPMGLSGALIYNSTHVGSMLIVGKVAEQSKFLMVQSSGKVLLASYLISSEKFGNVTYKLDELRFVPKEKPGIIIKEQYVVYKDGVWEEFKLNKSNLAKFFKRDKKELQSLASEKEININTKIGLVALFSILNKK